MSYHDPMKKANVTFEKQDGPRMGAYRAMADDFSSEITDSSLRAPGLIDRLLIKIKERAEAQSPQGICTPQDEAPKGRMIVSSEIKDLMGKAMGEATIRGDRASLEAIGRLFALDSDCYEEKTLLDAMSVLQEYGRMDLVRPMVAVMRNACLQRWNVDAPNRIGLFTQDLNTTGFPDLHSLSLEQQKEFQSRMPQATKGIRGASAWEALERSMSLAIAKIENNIDSTIPRQFMVAATDVVITLPEARPWAVHVLISMIERRSIGWGEIEEKDWLQRSDRLIKLTTGPEAACLLRRCSDQILFARRMAGKNGEQLIDHLARMVVIQHPEQSMDDWFTAGISNEIQPSNQTSRRDNIRERKAAMVGDPWMMGKGGNHDRIWQVCESYDILMGWLDMDRVSEMNLSTHKRLKELVNHKGAAGSPISILRSAVDRWTLVRGSHNHGGQQTGREDVPSDRPARRRSL
jgi:hypothetical protein